MPGCRQNGPRRTACRGPGKEEPCPIPFLIRPRQDLGRSRPDVAFVLCMTASLRPRLWTSPNTGRRECDVPSAPLLLERGGSGAVTSTCSTLKQWAGRLADFEYGAGKHVPGKGIAPLSGEGSVRAQGCGCGATPPLWCESSTVDPRKAAVDLRPAGGL